MNELLPSELLFAIISSTFSLIRFILIEKCAKQKLTLPAVLQINACNMPKKIDNICEENRR